MDTMGLLHRIEIGFSFKELEHFQAVLSMPMERVAELVHITPRTLNRRKEQGRLLPDESDRLVRISRVFGRTLELFEDDVEAARHWLSSPQPALGGAVPLSIAKTDTGSREVEDLIGRLEHGVFS
jgi:putative toxin-antitoxin system antitoxin component (TIGR02293 family)